MTEHYGWIVEGKRDRSFRCPCCSSLIIVNLDGTLFSVDKPRDPIDWHQLFGDLEAATTWLKLARKYVLLAVKADNNECRREFQLARKYVLTASRHFTAFEARLLPEDDR